MASVPVAKTSSTRNVSTSTRPSSSVSPVPNARKNRERQAHQVSPPTLIKMRSRGGQAPHNPHFFQQLVVCVGLNRSHTVS